MILKNHKDKIRVIEKHIGKHLKSGKDWAREVKILNKLIELNFREKDFWDTVEFGFEFNSFAYFICKEGREVLTRYHDLFLEEQQSLEIKKLRENLN